MKASQFLPTNSIGSFYAVKTDSNGELLYSLFSFQDAWVSEHYGHSLIVDGVLEEDKVLDDFINITYKVPINYLEGESLKILFAAHNDYNYNKSFIKDLFLSKN